MEMERFSSDIKYKIKTLRHPSDIVKHSFIVQTSISYLDLEVSPSDRERTRFTLRYPISSYGVLTTEEKCQKVHLTRRKLLYYLHLDLPKAREFGLKSEFDPNELELWGDAVSLAKIKISEEFYTEKMSYFIQYAYTHPSLICTYRIEKFLKWFMKLDELKYHALLPMPPNVLRHIVDCMVVESRDSEFVEKCLKKFHFLAMLRDNDKPERVENLLYLVHLQGSRLDSEIWRCGFSDHCLMHPSFEYVREILKFLNAPHLCQLFIYRFREEIIVMRDYQPFGHVSTTPFQAESERRRALLFHLYWSYLDQPTDPIAASESLWLVWSSVNDSFFSYDELTFLLESHLDPEEIADVWDFYSNAVGEHHEDGGIRSLKHLCRSSIRYQLWESLQWLPEGIEQLDIPTELQSYLKLEE